MGRVKRIRYLSPMRAAKVQASLNGAQVIFFFCSSVSGLVLLLESQTEPRQANLCLRAFRHDKF